MASGAYDWDTAQQVGAVCVGGGRWGRGVCMCMCVCVCVRARVRGACVRGGDGWGGCACMWLMTFATNMM